MNQPQATTPLRSFWQRYWKWIIAACSVPLIVVLVAFALLVFIFFTVSSHQGNASPYPQAVAMARADPAVIAVLGQPIKSGGIIGGSIRDNVSGGRTAKLTVPLSGPKAAGMLRVDAVQSNGHWTYQTLVVRTDSGRQAIDLLH